MGPLQHASADFPSQIREALRLPACPARSPEVVPADPECHTKSFIPSLVNSFPPELQILTWNVCGLQLDDGSLFAFTCQLQNDLTSWDILLLREVTASSRGQRLILKGLHARWAASVEEFQTGADESCRLDLNFKYRVCGKFDSVRAHSAHLPHYGYDDDTYQLALDTLSSSVGIGLGVNRFHVIGMDANSAIGPVGQHGDVDHENALQDCSLVGPWGVGRRCRRGAVLLESARSAGMDFANTFFYPGSNDGCTHVQWSSKSRSQIGYLMLPAK